MIRWVIIGHMEVTSLQTGYNWYWQTASVISFPSAKIKNIIQTEDAKARLLAEQRNKKKDQGTSFVPTNIAVNYVQHNRCGSSQSVNIGFQIVRAQQKVMRWNVD